MPAIKEPAHQSQPTKEPVSHETKALEEYVGEMQAAIRQAPSHDLRESAAIGGEVLDKSQFSDQIRKLSKVSPLRSLWAIAFQWMVIIAAAGVAIWSGHWAVYILSAIVITTRQHAFGILVHDASHYRLFHNRTVNDLLTDILIAFHMGMSCSLYRRWHFPHHRYVNTERDPEWMGEQTDPETWSWPKRKIDMARVFLKDIFGFNIPKMAAIMGLWSPWARIHLSSKDPAGIPIREKVSLVLFTAAGVSALAYHGLLLDYFLLWILPSMTIFNVIFKFRSYAEHKVVRNEDELSNTRTVIPRLIEKALIAPLNVNYHLEHHLFPSVPFYNLGRLHRLLMKDPVFKEKAQLTESYLDPHTGVLAELTTLAPDSSAA